MKKKSRIYSDDFSVNLNRALRFLSFRPRSEKEIQDFFKKKQVDLLTSQKIIDKLKEQKFINDEEFVKWWIEQRTKIKPRAARLIKFELKQKGIAKELIDEVFKDKDFETVSDFDKAIKLAQKRMVRLKNETPKKAYEKLGRFLASKGFDYDIIKKVIDQVLEK